MVDKKKSGINKSEFLIMFLVLIAIGFMFFVFAATSVTSPVAFGNYSTNMLLNCTTTLNASTTSYNVTFYYNASGGATGTSDNLTSTIWNSTADDGVFNITADISGLGDALKLYNITCYADNGTDQEFASAVANATIDNTAPNVSFSGITNTVEGGSYKDTIVVNVSVVDPTIGIDSVYFNITNSTGDQHNFTKASTPGSGYYNITVDTTKFTDGVYTITVYANDTELDNLNNTEIISVTFDDTAPTPGSLIKSSSTKTSLTITFSGADGTCTADRSGASISGSTLTETGLSCGTSYAYIITCVDAAGNSGSSASTSFTTSSCTSSGGGGGSSSTKPKVHSWTKITPGAATIMKNFDKALGIKEIQIEVNNPAQNVKITVTKYDNKPAEVTKEKTGKVHKYLKIDAKNLENKLDKATITIKVEKSWISNNALDKNNIAMFKFDETSEKWNELKTTYTESDDDYDYYDVELTSFSYFAIGEKVKVTGGAGATTGGDATPAVGGDEGATPEHKDLTWLWILIGILILGAVVGGGIAVKKKK